MIDVVWMREWRRRGGPGPAVVDRGEGAEAAYTDTYHFNFIFNILFIVLRTRSKDCYKTIFKNILIFMSD